MRRKNNPLRIAIDNCGWMSWIADSLMDDAETQRRLLIKDQQFNKPKTVKPSKEEA